MRNNVCYSWLRRCPAAASELSTSRAAPALFLHRHHAQGRIQGVSQRLPPPPAFSWPRYNFQKHFIVVCWSDNCFVSVPSPTPGEILDPTPMRGRILKVCSYVCRMLLNRGVFCPYRYYIGFFMFYQKEVRVVYAVVLRIYLFTSGIV